jgi:ABC-2 type transport system permease protein
LTLAISVFVKSNEAFNAILNVLFTPLMFLSSIYYPLEKAPIILQAVSLANPLTYAADMLRAGLLQVYVPYLPMEIATLVAESLAAFAVATIAFRRVKT